MARKRMLLEGTVEEQLSQADNILNKLVRKSRGQMAKVIIPPVPVMSCNYDRATGKLISAVIPSRGIITTLAMYVELAEGANSASFEALIKGPKLANNMSFSIKHILTMDTLNIPVSPGDVLIVRAIDPAKVRDASVSILYQVDIDKADIMRQMIEEPE